jgi:hypothetical protein
LQFGEDGFKLVIVKNETLAQRLGTTAHLSPLLMKAKRLGLQQPEDLERLAVRRGCLYYDFNSTTSSLFEEPDVQVLRKDFTNAELAIALLSPCWPKCLNRQRIGAAMLSALDVEADTVAELAKVERCETLVSYIAKCGAEVEPENPFWKMITDQLGSFTGDVHQMPHPTRFIEMTGITRGKIGIQKHWVRPAPALAMAP